MFQKLIFEPWHFGDAIIAAAALRTQNKQCALVCNSQWHEFILLGMPEAKDQLLSLDAAHVSHKNKFKLSDSSFDSLELKRIENIPTIYSIRGDIRDYILAKQTFRSLNPKIKMSGWLPFLAWRVAFFDSFFKSGLFKTKDRYQLWANVLGIPFDKIEQYYPGPNTIKKQRGCIVLHVGAQWLTKQYPHVKELKSLLLKKNIQTKIIAGPRDRLPMGVEEQDVSRPNPTELKEVILAADFFVANDSGPLHFAAFLGQATLSLNAVVNSNIWAPPNTICLTSRSMPLGYRPHKQYASHQVLDDWPPPEDVCFKVRSLLESKN